MSQKIENKFLYKQSMFFYPAVYVLMAAVVIASGMIWYYYGYGQWAMDDALQGFMKNIRTPWLDSFFKAITATGETIPVVIFTAAIVAALVIYRKRKEALLTALYMLATWRLNHFLKELIQRPRPAVSMRLVEIDGFSLPSGHSMNFMALVLLGLYLLWVYSENKKLNIILTVLLLAQGLLVGISRIYLNVHYLSDVITGWSLAIACAATAIIFHRLLYVRKVR